MTKHASDSQIVKNKKYGYRKLGEVNYCNLCDLTTDRVIKSFDIFKYVELGLFIICRKTLFYITIAYIIMTKTRTGDHSNG